jgi:2-polyprenyl-3-methyl-5-hydroxy-6-metoxy-1,4-benzoquinol methylase
MDIKNYASLNLNEIRSDEFGVIQENAYKNDLVRLHKRLIEFVSVPCPACGGERADYRFEKYKCKFLECVICSTIYMSPRPTQDVMDDYYSNSENYAIWNKYIFPKSEASRREKICRPNLDRIIEECKRLGLAKPALLEIGPGFGTFSLLAHDSGFFSSVSVVERTPSMAESCRGKGLHVVESALEDVSIDFLETADVVVCFEVIEHVFSPIEFLASLSRMLKPGGIFLFTCPNGKGFDTGMLCEASPSVDTEHVNLFNPQSAAVLLKRAGFEVLCSETPGRLDVELVRRALMDNKVDLADTPFWRTLLCENFETTGRDFQQFLIEHKLAGSMRVIARKNANSD